MICNFTSGNEFIGVVNYANRDDRTTKARVIASEGVCTVTNQSIADSFVIQALMRPDAKEPVRHISISFHPDDAPKFPETEKGDEFMTQIVMDWMEAMGFRNTQFLLVRHHDHDHPHCHLVLNRVDNDGNLLNLRNDLRRNVTVCKRLKKKYGLTFGKSDGKRVNRDRLRGYDLHKYDIRMAARKAIESATTWREFRNLLAKEGVKLHVAFSKDGQVNGVSYQLGDFRITGSKLDKHLFTYGKLSEISRRRLVRRRHPSMPESEARPKRPAFHCRSSARCFPMGILRLRLQFRIHLSPLTTKEICIWNLAS